MVGFNGAEPAEARAGEEQGMASSMITAKIAAVLLLTLH